MKIIIIGAGTAGIDIARKIRFNDKNSSIILIDNKGDDLYSPCSLPYFVGNKINKEDLYVYNNYSTDNLIYYRGYEPINLEGNILTISNSTSTTNLEFDNLVFATGSIPNSLNFNNSKNIHFLKTIEDAEKLKKLKGKFLIIGGGFIGCELSAELINKGNKVHLVETKNRLLNKILDDDMSKIVRNYLENLGVDISLNTQVENLENNSFDGTKFDHIVITTGFIPNYKVIEDLGLPSENDQFLRVRDNIYVAGDLVKSKNIITGKYEYCMLANNALKESEVVVNNILGDDKYYEGFINNSLSKIGELIVGSVGGISEELDNSLSAKFKGKDKYFSLGGQEYTIKLILDKNSEILKGGQIIGFSEVAGRLNHIYDLIYQNKGISDLLNINSCYNPAVSPLQDPLVEVAKITKKKLDYLKK